MLSGKDFDFSTNFLLYLLISFIFLFIFFTPLEETEVTILDKILISCFFMTDMGSLLSYTGIWEEIKI